MESVKTIFRGYRKYEIRKTNNKFLVLENGTCKFVCNSQEEAEKKIDDIIKDKLARKQAQKLKYALNRR